MTLLAVSAVAQTTREAMLADITKCAGLYTPYPDSVASPTPAPGGYVPFYVGQYGRHGSRYLGTDAEYDRVADLLARAADRGQLTSFGKDVSQRVSRIRELARGRGGELAPLGYRQHSAIAGRLLCECGEAFGEGARVTAVSTIYMRCAHSMFAFVQTLKEFNPGLDVTVESCARNMCYLSHLNSRANEFNASGKVTEPFAAFRAKMIDPRRLMASLFVDPQAVVLPCSQSDFAWWLYIVAIDLPNLECDARLWDVFTPDELFNLWQVFNYEYYTYHSGNPISGGAFIDSAKPLLKNFVDSADVYVASGRCGATLRFGHDSSVIPLAGLLQFPEASARVSDPSELYKSYTDWRVSPMASNIQMRLYRNDSGDIIACFMLNEREMPLPDTPTDIYPYYRWQDARATLLRLIETD